MRGAVLLVLASLLVLAPVLALHPVASGTSLRVYVLVIGALVLNGLVRSIRAHERARRAPSPFERARRAPSPFERALRPRTRVAAFPAPLERLERDVDLVVASGLHVESRLVPLVREIVEACAATALPPRVAQLLRPDRPRRGRDDRGLAVAELRGLVEELEAL